MSEPKPIPRWVPWAYYVVTFAVLAYTAWCIHDLMRSDEDDLERRARSLMQFSRACQKVAGTVGAWGVKAEVAYHDIMEQERMN